MNNNEIYAQRKFHEISDKLETLHSDFSKFNAENISNINSEDADIFRQEIKNLESEADSYFKQFAHSKPR